MIAKVDSVFIATNNKKYEKHNCRYMHLNDLEGLKIGLMPTIKIQLLGCSATHLLPLYTVFKCLNEKIDEDRQLAIITNIGNELSDKQEEYIKGIQNNSVVSSAQFRFTAFNLVSSYISIYNHLSEYSTTIIDNEFGFLKSCLIIRSLFESGQYEKAVFSKIINRIDGLICVSMLLNNSESDQQFFREIISQKITDEVIMKRLIY